MKKLSTLIKTSALLLSAAMVVACNENPDDSSTSESESTSEASSSSSSSSSVPEPETPTAYNVTIAISFIDWEDWMTNAVIKGGWDNWANETSLVYDSSAFTLTATLSNVAAGTYEWGAQINGDFTGQSSTWLWLAAADTESDTTKRNASLTVGGSEEDITLTWSAVTHGELGDVHALAEGDISLYDSTESDPWTAVEFARLLARDGASDGFEYTGGKVYVESVVKQSQYYSSSGSYNAYLEAGDYTVEAYWSLLADGVTAIENDLLGATILVEGYAKIYGSTYELSRVTIGASYTDNPSILSVTYPDGTFTQV